MNKPELDELVKNCSRINDFYLLEEFQDFVVKMRRLQDPKDIKTECLLGLSSEVGEIHDVYKKQLRDKKWSEEEFNTKVKDELSDLVHYLFSILETERLTIIDVIRHNIHKIALRYKDVK